MTGYPFVVGDGSQEARLHFAPTSFGDFFSGLVVTNNGVLSGSVTMSNTTVTVHSGGGVSPGWSIIRTPAGPEVGSMTVSNLVLNSGAVYNWEYDATTNDVIQVMGDVTLPSAMTVNVTSLGGSFVNNSVLMTYGGNNLGAVDLNGWTIVGAPAGVKAKLDATGKRVLLGTSYYKIRVTPDNKRIRTKNGKVYVKEI